MANDLDKRKDTRVSVKEGVVRFKPTGGHFTFLKGSSEEMPIINVSQRGMRFLSRNKLLIGEKLSFNIGIPLLGSEPLVADGRIVWVDRSHRYEGYLIGVKFTAMTRESMSRLKNLVSFMASRVKVKQKVKITFSDELKQQPVLWYIARDFDVTANIREGLLTDQAAWMVVEFVGEREEIRRVLEYLKHKGAKLAFPKRL